MRAERVAENELYHDMPGLEGRIFTVGKVSVGGIYDFYSHRHAKFGIGGLVSAYGIPSEGLSPSTVMIRSATWCSDT